MRFTSVAIGPTSERRTKMGDAAAPNTPTNKIGKAQRSAKGRTKTGPSSWGGKFAFIVLRCVGHGNSGAVMSR